MKRVPRPLGITMLSRRYQKTQSEEDYQELLKQFTNHYLNNNFNINGEYITIDTFCFRYDVPRETVESQLLNASKHGMQKLLNTDDPDKIQGTLRALWLRLFEFSLEDRGLISQQLAMLHAQQDGQYVPFLTSEYNKVLKTLVDSTKSVRDVLGTIIPSQNGQGGLPVVPERQQETGTFGPDEAIKLLNEKEPKALVPGKMDEEAQKLYQKYSIEDTPDVDARSMQSEKTTPTLQLNDVLKNSEAFVQKKSTQEHHDDHLDRRANQLNIDTEADEL